MLVGGISHVSPALWTSWQYLQPDDDWNRMRLAFSTCCPIHAASDTFGA
jgi:hypothetical protein